MKLRLSLILLLFAAHTTFAQIIIRGTTGVLSYISGSTSDSQMKLKSGGQLVIGFRKILVEATVITGNTGQSLLAIDESNEWTVMQACEYDFDKDGRYELLLAYGDGISQLNVIVFKKVKTEYKEVGNLEGQSICSLSNGRIVLPYGSKNLFTEYIWQNGKLIQTN